MMMISQIQITVAGSYLYSLLLSLCHETRAIARTHTHARINNVTCAMIRTCKPKIT